MTKFTQVELEVKRQKTKFTKKRLKLKKVYGTAGYNSVALDDSDLPCEYCETFDRKHRWLLQPTEIKNNFHETIRIIRGDSKKILDLVKAEIEHFDCEVIITKNVRAVYGCIWLKDKTQLQFEGELPDNLDFLPENIVSYGEHEIGNEAGIFVRFDDGTEKNLTGLENVKAFFTDLLAQ